MALDGTHRSKYREFRESLSANAAAIPSSACSRQRANVISPDPQLPAGLRHRLPPDGSQEARAGSGCIKDSGQILS